MKCEHCGKELPESAKFCLECGTKVKRNVICSSCGAILPPDAKFCLECGASMAPNTAESKDNAAKAPRKEPQKAQQKEPRDLSELKRDSRVDTVDDVRRFIRNYLRIIGYTELKDLGGGYYYLCGDPHNSAVPESRWPRYLILNLNDVGDFMEKDGECGFQKFYDGLSVEYGRRGFSIRIVLELAHILANCGDTPCDWISKPVDGKMYYLLGGGAYKYLNIVDFYTQDREKRYRSVEATIKPLSFASGENRVLIISRGCDAFFLFDLDGNLIVKKEGNYTLDHSIFGYAVLIRDFDSGWTRGLYDEITGAEILPCRYFEIQMWVKEGGRGNLRYRKELLLTATRTIDRGGRMPDLEPEYFCYDPQSGTLSPMTAEMGIKESGDANRLGYVNYFDLYGVSSDFTKTLSLECLDPKVAKERKKKR